MDYFDRRELLQLSVAGVVTLTSTGLVAAGETCRKNPVEEETNTVPSSNYPRLTPFLTFTGKANEAIKFYLAIFDDSEVVSIEHYAAEECNESSAAVKPGYVKHADVRLAGQRVMFIDSPVKHDWSFTPAVSLYVEDPDVAAVTRYFEILSEGGKVFMPLDRYPFSTMFAWIEDRYGVSWQLNAS